MGSRRSSTVASGTHSAPPQGMLRFTVESAILLAMAVTLFRAFFAEGYMISTGSMAPSLLGFHKQVCCPACAYQFARGAALESAAADGTATASTQDRWLDGETTVTARCPNCGTAVADASVPRTEGDQLMVHKHHYDWRDPERWEVVVFRNPELQTQAYVKRVVGLPGETIELRDGDVYADGELRRKPIDVQRSLRIPVDDAAHQPVPDDPDWRPRWLAAAGDTAWRSDGRQFRFAADAGGSGSMDWVQYHHWVRAGGRHISRVPLASWPQSIAEPGLVNYGFRFDAEAKELEAVGAMPHTVLTSWLDRLPAEPARTALRELYLRSHQPPISDVCAYNHPDAATASFPVHDLMLECTTRILARRGEFVLALHDGCHELRCTFDLENGVSQLTADEKPEIHREAPLPEALLAGEPVMLTMSQFDRQVLVAVDGELLFDPLLYASAGDRPLLPSHPVRFGARQADVEVSQLRLDRDVYYTAATEEAGRTFTLEHDEFFVLGDNSPVSHDSRAWSHPAVPRELLIGRPFVVHLPSRPQPVQWGNRQIVVRVPDFSRVRYIR